MDCQALVFDATCSRFDSLARRPTHVTTRPRFGGSRIERPKLGTRVRFPARTPRLVVVSLEQLDPSSFMPQRGGGATPRAS